MLRKGKENEMVNLKFYYPGLSIKNLQQQHRRELHLHRGQIHTMILCASRIVQTHAPPSKIAEDSKTPRKPPVIESNSNSMANFMLHPWYCKLNITTSHMCNCRRRMVVILVFIARVLSVERACSAHTSSIYICVRGSHILINGQHYLV